MSTHLMAGCVRALAIVLALAWTGASVGCSAPAQSVRSKVARNDAVIEIECSVAEAELWVNDRFIAHVGKLPKGIALSPGEHRLELRHDRHHTHYEMLTVSARERRTLTVQLAEVLP